MTEKKPCELCTPALETLLVQTSSWRIIAVDDPEFAGFTRVIWNAHVREMSDLDPAQRQELMQVVFEVERIMRQYLNPDKVNLACLGNQVPHIHWHVIPRWRDDVAFPAPIWNHPSPSEDRRRIAKARISAIHGNLPDYHQALINNFIRYEK